MFLLRFGHNLVDFGALNIKLFNIEPARPGGAFKIFVKFSIIWSILNGFNQIRSIILKLPLSHYLVE